MALAYAIANAVASLGASAFTWSSADTTNRAFLNDGRMDQLFLTSSASGGLSLVIDMGSAVSLAGFAVLNSNIAGAGGTPTLRVRAATDSGISTGVITPKSATTLNLIEPRQKDHVLQFAATAAKRYWELAWTWTGSFQLKLGEVFAFAASTQLSRTGIYGSGGGESFKSVQTRLAYGNIRAFFLAGPFRRVALKWADHNASQLAELQALWRGSKGLVRPFLFIPSYEAVSTAAAADQQECLFGRAMSPGDDFNFEQPDFNLFGPPDLTIVSEPREVGA